MRPPVLGFRTWAVAKPVYHRIYDGTRMIPRAAQPSGGLAEPDPELQKWLDQRTSNRMRSRFKTRVEQPEVEVGTLFPIAGAGVKSNPWAEPGPVRFECVYDGHQQPQRNHSCGLHAYLTAAQAAEAATDVVGAVTAWGHLVIHEVEAFRAEWMQIVALSVPPPRYPEDEKRAKKGLWARKAAERLNVPFVPFNRLEQVGREFGNPITWEYHF